MRKKPDKRLRKPTELKRGEEVNATQWLEERFERIVKSYQKMRKAERDRDSG